MVSELVIVRVYLDSLVTVATFSMQNEGEMSDMTVGFPDPGGFDRFRAFVDGKVVQVRDGSKEDSLPFGKKSTVHWKLWDMTFRAKQTCEIRVEYGAKPYVLNGTLLRPEDLTSVPDDVRETIRRSSTYGVAEYTLETGSPWKGKLDHCKVSFDMVGMSSDHIRDFSPKGASVSDHSITWEYENYEPTRSVSIEYFPYLSKTEVKDAYQQIVGRFPDNAPLVYQIGRSCAYHLRNEELQREIYRAFLTRWNKPIPQLMEYAPGGRCRVNLRGERNFFSTWSMGWDLFNQYERTGQLEKGRDLAPKVSMMCSAVVDSLAKCNGLASNDEWLARESKKIRDLCSQSTKRK